MKFVPNIISLGGYCKITLTSNINSILVVFGGFVWQKNAHCQEPFVLGSSLYRQGSKHPFTAINKKMKELFPYFYIFLWVSEVCWSIYGLVAAGHPRARYALTCPCWSTVVSQGTISRTQQAEAMYTKVHEQKEQSILCILEKACVWFLCGGCIVGGLYLMATRAKGFSLLH